MGAKYKYFVSYKWYGSKRNGVGSIQYATNSKMDIEVIRECEQDLIEANDEITKCIIMNFQLLNDEDYLTNETLRIKAEAREEVLKELSSKISNDEIVKHIESECRHEDGSHMMREQEFYEGAKWMRDQILNPES